MSFVENEYACVQAKSSTQSICQNNFKIFTRHFNRTIVFAALVASMLCASSFKSNATWWTEAHNANDPSGSHFKANFNPFNGTIHIESYVYNGDYFLVAAGPLTYATWVQLATISYSTDGINYVDFYRFGFDYGNQKILTQLGDFTARPKNYSFLYPPPFYSELKPKPYHLIT